MLAICTRSRRIHRSARTLVSLRSCLSRKWALGHRYLALQQKMTRVPVPSLDTRRLPRTSPPTPLPPCTAPPGPLSRPIKPVGVRLGKSPLPHGRTQILVGHRQPASASTLPLSHPGSDLRPNRIPRSEKRSICWGPSWQFP